MKYSIIVSEEWESNNLNVVCFHLLVTNADCGFKFQLQNLSNVFVQS